MRKTLTALSLAVSTAAFGASFSPTSEGDMAAETTGNIWGGGVPGPSDSLLMDRSGTYTASADLSIAAMTVTADTVTFDFTGTPGRKVGITSTQEHIFEMKTEDNSVLTFKGGIWDFVNNTAYNKGDPALFLAPAKTGRHTVRLTDGALITNLSMVITYDSGGYNKLLLDGGSRLHVHKQVRLAHSRGRYNNIEVTDGSSIYVEGGFWLDNNGSGAATDGHNEVLVSGTGSLIRSPGGMDIARNSAFNKLTVANGAEVVLGSTKLGTAATATDVSFVVTNGATASVGNLDARYAGGRILVDAATLTSKSDIIVSGGACLEVTNGASVTIASDSDLRVGENGRARLIDGSTFSTGWFQLNGSEFLLEDAHLSVGTFQLSSDARFRMCGASATLAGVVDKANSFDIFEKGSVRARFELEGGAVLNDTAHTYYTMSFSGATNCVLRLAGANTKFAVADGKETFGFGDQRHPWDSLSNVVEVVDGACLDVGQVRHTGLHNTLVISNGTICSSHMADNFYVGYRHYQAPEGQYPTNATVILRGTTPFLNYVCEGVQKRISLENCSVLRFEIPEEGYPDGHVPVLSYGLRFNNANQERMEVDCAAFAARLNKPNGKLVLVRNLGEDFPAATKAVVAACAATLPPKCRLAVEGREIVLRCPTNSGMAIIVR